MTEYKDGLVRKDLGVKLVFGGSWPGEFSPWMMVLINDDVPMQYNFKCIEQPMEYLFFRDDLANLGRSLPAVAAGVFRQFGPAD